MYNLGDEGNFQEGERETQDTTGHGTAVAGCATYGNIKECIDEKIFNPSNFIFSTKVMYADKDLDGNVMNATYNPEKLLENQLLDAVNTLLTHYCIKSKY